MRAFTLLEVMVVVVIVGILSAAGGPSIVAMVEQTQSQNALIESSSAMSMVRDVARSQGLCIDYIVHEPNAPTTPTYTMEVLAVSCPGDPVTLASRSARRRSCHDTSRASSSTDDRRRRRPPTKVIHFDRNGGLYNPIAELRIDGRLQRPTSTIHDFSRAGTISFEEVK